MALDIFDFSDYRAFLLAALGDKSQRRGLKSEAAEFIGCHTSVISQVLSGKIELSLEQAEKMSRFLNLDEDSSHYFLLMLQKERSGTQALKSYFQKQIRALIESRTQIKRRLGKTSSISKEDELRYYSRWQYAAVHVAVSVPELRTAETLARHLKIPMSDLSEVLSFLERTGLIVREGAKYAIGPKHLHLGADSPHIWNHHRNWRIKALETFDARDLENLHYSAAVTLSRDDIALVKEQMIRNLKELGQTITASKEEEVFALSFDFFKL